MIAPDPVDQSTQEIIATFLWSGRHHVLDTYWQAIEALGPALTPPQSRAAGCHSFIETNGTVAARPRRVGHASGLASTTES